MYADILRSYSAAAIGPTSTSVNGFNGDWLQRASSREPLRLKLSILSDTNPTARSILNGSGSSRSCSSMWSSSTRDSDQARPSRSRDYDESGRKTNGLTLAFVGVRRTPVSRTRPMEDRFPANPAFSESPAAERRGRVGSESAVARSRLPARYPKTDRTFVNDSERRPSPLSVYGNFTHDQQRGVGAGSVSNSRYDNDIDVDDAFDEVFASIVRRASSDDAVSSTPAQSSLAVYSAHAADNSELLPKNVLRPCYNDGYERTGMESKRHPAHLITQPFLVKRAISSSAVIDPPRTNYSWLEKQHQHPKAEPFFQQPEKVRAGAGAKNAAPWSYQPCYYRSATASTPEIDNRRQLRATPAVAALQRNDCGFEREENLQKSEPFLNRKQDSLEKIDRGEKKTDASESVKKRDGDERLAAGVSSYYAEDITTSSGGNRRRLFESGGGQLRTAKSESSLRMPNKELLLSDKEIYQVEIMNSGLSASRVYVCQCLANLYFDDGASSSVSNGGSSDSPWRRIATGVPVLVSESEQPSSSTRPKPSRKLLIRLAELGNGFKIWEDVIDACSGYSVDRTFHTLATSADYNRRAGLSFDSHSAALKFHQHLREFSEELDCFGDGGDIGKRRNEKSIWAAFRRANTVDGSSSNGGRKPDFGFSTSRRNPNWMVNTPDSTGSVKKTDISMPCCFKHVTSLKAGDVLPSAMLVSSSNSDYPSSVPSTTNTLTRVNRSATIESTNSKFQSSIDMDEGGELLDFGGVALPKRAKSCTQILSDHAQKRNSKEENRLSPCQLMDNANTSNGSYLWSESSNGSYCAPV